VPVERAAGAGGPALGREIPRGALPEERVAAAKLKKGERLESARGVIAVADGGTVPADHDGWMWDLTVPGNNDHDFYIGTTVAAVLAHNTDGPCPTAPNQMLQQVKMGHAPREVKRVDTANPGTDDAQAHIHFKAWRSTLNQDGTCGPR
jgi:hypothetical protein